MCANQRFEVATWFNTFGEIRVDVVHAPKFTHKFTGFGTSRFGRGLGMVDAVGAGTSLDDA